MNTSYYCRDSGQSAGSTKVGQIVPTLQRMGYTSNYLDNLGNKVNGDTIYQNIVNYGPLLMFAVQTFQNGMEMNPQTGHIWVVDGIYRKWRTCYCLNAISYPGDSYYRYAICKYRQRITHIHCNWGWAGSSDGWYYYFAPACDDYDFKQFRMCTQIKYKG